MSFLSVNFRLRNKAERNAGAPNTLLDLLTPGQTEASFTTLETLTFCTYVDRVASIYMYLYTFGNNHW
jgi:hypothetical protein